MIYGAYEWTSRTYVGTVFADSASDALDFARVLWPGIAGVEEAGDVTLHELLADVADHITTRRVGSALRTNNRGAV